MKYLILLTFSLIFCLSANGQTETRQGKALAQGKDTIAKAKANKSMKDKHWNQIRQEFRINKKECDYLENFETLYLMALEEGDRLRQHRIEMERGRYLQELFPAKEVRKEYEKKTREHRSKFQTANPEIFEAQEAKKGTPRLRQ